MDQLDNYWRFHPLKQKTLRQPIWCRGVCLHSGLISEVQLMPADVDTGIVFHVIDKFNNVKTEIPATVDHTYSGMLRTVLKKDEVSLDTTEHLLAALSALGINNLIIKVWGNEIPIFDGSAGNWTFLADCAGIVEQGHNVQQIKIIRTKTVKINNAWCSLAPYDGYKLCYHMMYEHPMIGERKFSIDLSRKSFDKELGTARTFGFFKDIDVIQAHGLAKGVSLSNTIVFNESAIMGTSLQWPDEPARHKVVDAIGDLSLAGAPILGKFYGFCSGHELNQTLVKAVLNDNSCWNWATIKH